MGFGKLLADPLRCRVTQVIVVVMTDDYYVDEGEVLDFTRDRCHAGKLLHGEGDAAVFEDGVEEDAETRGELDVEAGVAKPCSAESLGVAVTGGTERRFCDWESDGGW